MNLTNDLFRLMIDISLLNSKEQIISQFLQEMTKRFHPARFSFRENKNQAGAPEKKGKRDNIHTLELRSENNWFGLIDIQNNHPLENEFITLAESAGRLVSLILDRLTCEEKIRENQKTLEQVAEERFATLQQTINELHKARKASLNLIEDLTEEIEKRKRTENVLEESEERYRLVLENSLDAILLTSPDGPIVSANPAACEMFQMSEDEICQTGRNGIVNLRDPNLTRLLEERKRTGKMHGELTHFRKDGTLFPAEITSSIYKNSRGEMRSSLIIRDISERKAYEEKLKNSDRIFEHTTDMMAVCGFDGFFQSVNPAFERTLGWSREELLSHPWMHFIHPDDRMKTKMIHEEIIHGRTAYHFENRYRCKDGFFKWLSWNAFPYSDEDIMFAVARDITRIKQDEEELRRLKDNLQVEVNQKTTELKERVGELERFQQATIEREFRIKELRNEIEQLKSRES